MRITWNVPWRTVSGRLAARGSPVAPFAYVARWTALAAPGAIAIGSAVALFLWALERATAIRLDRPWLLWLLPAAGLVVGGLYHWLGRSAEGGNNLIMDEIHKPGGGVPARMAPLVLVGTVLTHLFGGSAGREGTAVQMGGSIASVCTRWFKLDPEDTSILLTTGIAAGFGAVFGTPLTGAIFALEVLTIGALSYRALVPCLIASLVGDLTVRAWGLHHASYSVAPLTRHGLDPLLFSKVALAAAVFGLASVLFAQAMHGTSRIFKRAIRLPMLRPVLGAAILIALALAFGLQDYLGLGVSARDPNAVTLASAFASGGAQPMSWAWKLLFTAITLGSGFKGGEVTPLFFVGATLGNTLAMLLHAPVDLFAALGFVAVFSGATNTPLACTMMGIELFGADAALYIATACFLAYLFSGHSGIYLAQRIGTPKGGAVPRGLTVSYDNHHRVPATSTGVPSHADLHGPYHPHATPQHVPSHAPHRALPIQAHAVGQVRVYLKATDRRQGAGWWRRLVGRRLADDLVAIA